MFRWLVNIVLLALPIVTTLGILLGIQQATGKPPLTNHDDPVDGGHDPSDNSLKNYSKCNQTVGIHPYTKGQGYTLNPNPWGWKEGNAGGICVDVVGHNNGSYTTKTTAPEFWITWQYPNDNPTLPVHAFANIMVEDTKVLPVALSDVSQINMDIEWNYSVGNYSWNSTSTTDETDLTDNDTNANVAIDMFLDADKTKALTPSDSKYEVMVWLAAFGPATLPLGYAKIIATQTVEDVVFNLHFDHNENKQSVLTWVAQNTTETFKGDISPLLSYIFTMDEDDFPSSSDYLGYIGMGTEAYYAKKEVTFHVPTLSIDIETK